MIAIFLGLLVGARHAFEPDHLAAVSTLVSTERGRNPSVLGLMWGLGHTISLLAVGVALVVVDAALPARLGVAFELAVAAMLVILGARAMIRGLRNVDGHVGTHQHHGVVHAHGGAHDHVHVGARALAWRPLTIGLVHGLAGSGALTALAFAELPSTAARVVYMALFGIGSIIGMAVATGVVGGLVGRMTHRRSLDVVTGAVSCVCGVLWAVPLVS
jgi:high-affinity nickel-transport protein